MFEVSIAKATAKSVVLEDAAPKMGRPPLGRDTKVSLMLDDESMAILRTLASHMGLRPGRVAGEVLIPLLKGLDLDAVVDQIEDVKAQSEPIVTSSAVSHREGYKMAS